MLCQSRSRQRVTQLSISRSLGAHTSRPRALSRGRRALGLARTAGADSWKHRETWQHTATTDALGIITDSEFPSDFRQDSAMDRSRMHASVQPSGVGVIHVAAPIQRTRSRCGRVPDQHGRRDSMADAVPTYPGVARRSDDTRARATARQCSKGRLPTCSASTSIAGR
jgi:hypothetical protein